MSKVIKNLEYISGNVGGEVKTSRRGTPHLVVKRDDVTYSVVFFARSGTYRVFFPYPADNQWRVDFGDAESVMAFFNKPAVRAHVIQGLVAAEVELLKK